MSKAKCIWQFDDGDRLWLPHEFSGGYCVNCYASEPHDSEVSV